MKKNTLIIVLTLINSFVYSSKAIAQFPFSAYKAEAEMQNFIVIGDTGKQTQAQRDVASSLKKYCEYFDNTCDAAWLLGDNLYHAGMSSADDPMMDIVFKDYYQDLNYPFYAILGNHDYGKLSLSLKRANYQIEYGKRNPQFIMPERFYVKVYKDAVVAFLDTTRMMWRRDIKVQAEMVLKASEFAKKNNLWFIVSGHHPYLSNGGHGNAGNYERVKVPYFASGRYVKKFLDKYICQTADLYLAGHDHSLQLLPGNQIGCKSYIVVSGAGGSGGDLKSTRNKVDFETSNVGYFHFKIESQKIEIRAVNSEAENVFTKTILR